MKKNSILAILAGIFIATPTVASAAYPVYRGYQTPQNNMAQRGGYAYPVQNMQAQQMPRQAAYPVQQYNNLPNNAFQLAAASRSNGAPMVRNSIAAAQTTRITGALPRVGSSATTAGRQYYQASDYDTLGESGLYIGLSASYTLNIGGSMSADYAGEPDSYYAPGAFKNANFKSDSVIPLQISVGAAINSDFRVDFSYLRYSGIGYPSTVETSTGDGFVEASVNGGAITSNSTMLNIYYNVDSFTGNLAGGSLRPYVGLGLGISLNTTSDYVVYDGTFYDETNGYGPGSASEGELTGISDVYGYHNGGTTEQFAFALEGGVTTELESGLKLDFFLRYANLGKVKTSGSIVVSQTEWLSDGSGSDDGEYQAPYDSVFHYTNWTETGRLSALDVGVRLRLEF